MARRQAIHEAVTREMFHEGYQQACDMLALTLNDPAIMGSSTMGEDMIKKIYDGMAQYDMEYAQAWGATQESEYFQDRLDKRLAQIFSRKYKHLLIPFRARYPAIRKARDKVKDYLEGKHRG